MRVFMMFLSLVATALLAGQAQAGPDPHITDSHKSSVEFTTWKIPWEKTRPRDPAVDEQGIVWFAGQGGDYVGRLNPANGDISKFDLPDGTGPHNVIVGQSGDIWIAGNKVGWIGRMDPEDGGLRQYSTADNDIEDPHTLIQASDGSLWFTAQWSNRIGHFDPATGKLLKVREVPSSRARPYGIALDSEQQPWIALLGTNQLATIENGELKTIELPRDDARPRRLAIVDDTIWYVDYAEGYLGVYEPASGKIQEWRSPSAGEARPYGMASDNAGRVWYVETGPQPNRWIGFDTRKQEFIRNVEIPDSGGAVRHMYFDADTNSIWFGMDTNFIGRARLPAR